MFVHDSIIIKLKTDGIHGVTVVDAIRVLKSRPTLVNVFVKKNSNCGEKIVIGPKCTLVGSIV